MLKTIINLRSKARDFTRFQPIACISALSVCSLLLASTNKLSIVEVELFRTNIAQSFTCSRPANTQS